MTTSSKSEESVHLKNHHVHHALLGSKQDRLELLINKFLNPRSLLLFQVHAQGAVMDRLSKRIQQPKPAHMEGMTSFANVIPISQVDTRGQCACGSNPTGKCADSVSCSPKNIKPDTTTVAILPCQAVLR